MKDIELDNKLGQLEEMESEMMSDESPFSEKKENMARKIMQKLSDVWPDEAPNALQLPIVPLIKVYVSAVNDAVKSEFLPEELACEMPRTDADLNYFSGKLGVINKPPHKRAFKKFLAQPVEEVEEEKVIIEEEPEESDPVLSVLKSYK